MQVTEIAESKPQTQGSCCTHVPTQSEPNPKDREGAPFHLHYHLFLKTVLGPGPHSLWLQDCSRLPWNSLSTQLLDWWSKCHSGHPWLPDGTEQNMLLLVTWTCVLSRHVSHHTCPQQVTCYPVGCLWPIPRAARCSSFISYWTPQTNPFYRILSCHGKSGLI